MSHPQLCAQLLGRPLPPQPGELGAPHVPTVAPSVQTRADEQGAQACRVVLHRFTGVCAVHGRFGIDEYDTEAQCPVRGGGR